MSAVQSSIGYGQLPVLDFVVLRGATVIDGLGNPPLNNATVVVEGDRIRSILSGQDPTFPTDATVIDVSGKFIIPGFVDTHVHWEGWMGEIFINHGITSVLAQGDISKEERFASQGSLSTPRMFHTGGRPRLLPSMSRQEVSQAMREYLLKEPDVAWFLQIRENNRQVYGWAAEQAHAAGLAVFGHAQDAGEAMDHGMDAVEHVWAFALPLMSAQEMEDFEEGRILHWATYLKEGKQLDELIEKAARNDVYLNPTLAYEWGALSPKIREREREIYLMLRNPDLSYFPKARGELLLHRQRLIKTYSNRYEHMPMVSKLSPEDLQAVQEGRRNVQRFIKSYVQGGAKIIAGTDAPGVASPGLGIHHEMELLVEAGLTPMQALQSSTSWGAELLAGYQGRRGNQRVGSLQDGNFADLVVLEADPLEDIANTKKIERVMKAGKFIEFGYHPEFFTAPPPSRPLTQAPEISALSPHRVIEGSPDLEIVIDGAGFLTYSVVKVDGVSLATIFESPRRVRVTIPASLMEQAIPDRFRMAGPDTKVGVFGDRSLSISVLNPPPSGGLSNSVSLMIQAEWHLQ
ncbi:MAG: amidohydrolase family protein [Acidobacteriota bacterium]